MSLSIIMLTHSSCIKLWPPVFDLIYKYLKNIKLNIMTDNANLFKSTVKYDNINIIYEYSEKDTTFFMRHSSIMNMINDNSNKYTCLVYVTDGEAPPPTGVKGKILWVLSSSSNMNNELPGPTIKLN